MLRTLMLLAILIVGLSVGCNRSGSKSSGSNSAEPRSSDSGVAGESSGQSGTVDAAQAQDPRTESMRDMVVSVANLMIEARQLELNSDYVAAIETWKEVSKRVSQEHGEKSWQAVNAALAVAAAEQRATWDFNTRTLVNELEQKDGEADLLMQREDFVECLIKRSEVCDLARRVWGDDSHLTAYLLFKQAQAHQAIGQAPEAEMLMIETLRIREAIMGKAHPEYAAALHALAILYQQQQLFDRAQDLMIESANLCFEVWGVESKAFATYLNDLGVLYYSQREYAKASDTFDQALASYRISAGEGSFDIAHCLFNMGNVKIATNDLAEAESVLTRALEILTDVRDERHEMTMQTRTNLATVALMKNDPATAEYHLQAVVQARLQRHGRMDPRYAKSLFQLGVAMGKQGKYEVAEPTLSEAYAIQSAVLPGSHPDRAKTVEVLALVFRKNGRENQAASLEAEHRQIASRPDR